jgi:hypothetical protein
MRKKLPTTRLRPVPTTNWRETYRQFHNFYKVNMIPACEEMANHYSKSSRMTLSWQRSIVDSRSRAADSCTRPYAIEPSTSDHLGAHLAELA